MKNTFMDLYKMYLARVLLLLLSTTLCNGSKPETCTAEFGKCQEQIKAIESGLLRAQELQMLKLRKIEFTMQHVLSKVAFLSDADVHAVRHSDKGVPHAPAHTAANLDGELLKTLSTQVNNLLHHKQSTMSGRNCSGQNDDAYTVCRQLEQKLNIFLANMQPKELRQMHASTRLNTKHIDDMQRSVELLAKLAQNNDKNCTHMLDYCQVASGELTSLAVNTNVLLKRIETSMQTVNERLERDGAKDKATNVTVATQTSVDSTSKGNITKNKEAVVVVDNEQPAKAGCAELIAPPVNGIYRFLTVERNEAGRDFNERYCVFAQDGGATWTLVQRRGPYDEQENFNRSWADYRAGFGHLSKDFWFGLEFIHKLVYDDDYELRIELEDHEGGMVWAEYGFLRLDSEIYNYNLLVGDYRGLIPDALQYHNGMDFSTYDMPNDRSGSERCAVVYGSGWWFDNCSESNLNGIYRTTPVGHNYVGIIWEHWHGDYSLKSTRMLIRPRETNASIVAIAQDYNDDDNQNV